MTTTLLTRPRRFDVGVVGAGPAGSLAARDLARRGARVALIDGSHPREKPCGGGMTARALDLIADCAIQAPAQVIDRAVFSAGAREARVDVSHGDTLRVFDRRSLDGSLLGAAVSAGAVHVPFRATAIERTSGGWRIACGPDSIDARWLLGADGPCGIVRKRVFRPFERRQLSIAAGTFVEGPSPREVVIRFTESPRGYLWSFPRPDHLAVGTCAQADETTPDALHAATDAWLDAYPPAASATRHRYAWPIPSLSAEDLPAERLSGDGWMLLGDAAGLVDPITREGLFFALRSGQLAADAMRHAVPERAYESATRDELHAELRHAAALKAAFFSPRFTSLLIDALEASASIRSVMIDLIAGRQSYATLRRRLFATLEFGLAWRLLRGRIGRR